MNRMNLGCADDVKEGWVNVDLPINFREDVIQWNATSVVPNWLHDFDFILVNHVLCTMKPEDVKIVLSNCYKMLKPGGKIQVIDMDIIKAFYAYENYQEDLLPIKEGNIDYKLCMHVSGYGTRLSLFTDTRLQDVLLGAGFTEVDVLSSSEYDTRPRESLIVEGTK